MVYYKWGQGNRHTTFALEDKVDTGNRFFIQKNREVLDYDNFGSVHDKLSILGAEAVIETIHIINSGNFTLQGLGMLWLHLLPKINKGKNWLNPLDKLVLILIT